MWTLQVTLKKNCHKPCKKYAGQEKCGFFKIRIRIRDQDPDPAENGPDPQPWVPVGTYLPTGSSDPWIHNPESN